MNAARPYLQPRGLSLLEVMMAAIVLAVCSMAMLNAYVTTTSATRQSAEYAAAVSAGRKKLEEICATNFDQIVARYGKYSPSVGNTFKVYMNESYEYKDTNGNKVKGQEVPGFYKTVNGVANYDAGEVVIVTSESALPSTYGYSCSLNATDHFPDYGNPGGIGFTGIPIDLNCDGNTTSGTCYDLSATPQIKTAVRLPVGVVVRWMGPHGPERYELWTLVSRY